MLGLPARLRPMLRIETIVLVVIAWLIATANGPWWSAASAGRSWSDPSNWLFIVAIFIAMVALHFALIAPVANRWTVRPLLSLLVIVSAAAAYYMRTFAVLMDPAMIRNILKTDTHEARELISWSLVGAILLWSLLPIAFIWWVRIEHLSWQRAVLTRIGSVLGSVLVAVLMVLLVSRDVTSMMRNQREMRYLITPGNLLYGLASNSASGARDLKAERAVVGADAHVIHVAMRAARPQVFVLVIGETARAVNFSLLGYGRKTTPELAQLDVTAFSDVTSCGTSTEVSVPCMFSPFGRADYDERRIRNSEGMLNVLARAGYAVKWLDNQSGCKGVCRGEGIDYQKLDPKLAPDICAGDECYDEILVRRLQAELAEVRENTVIVLHMMGNHGPAYFRRYPAAFRRFTPDCATAELRDCSREQVVNAYDNAILYTDHVLAGVVRALARQSRTIDTAMLYVSDHGESLGENGLYLHGLPYSIAPNTQKHVPMVVWLSPQFSADASVDRACVRAESGAKMSHDNLFHSVLGLLDVQTAVYRADRDLFAPCRRDRTQTFAAAMSPGSRLAR